MIRLNNWSFGLRRTCPLDASSRVALCAVISSNIQQAYAECLEIATATGRNGNDERAGFHQYMPLGQLLFNYIQARKLVFSATAALFEGVNLFVKRIIRAKRVDAAEVFYLFFYGSQSSNW